jgi:hypothetical protein
MNTLSDRQEAGILGATVERVYGHHSPDYLRTDSRMEEATG